ncbi:ABC transporter substrate-binding protein [Roseburia inulinivorans]
MKLKKVLAVSLAAAMTLSMAACGSNEGTSSTDSNAAPSTETGSASGTGSDASADGELSYAGIVLGESYTDITTTIHVFNQRTDMAEASYPGKNWDAYIADFNKMYPNITVEIETDTNYSDDSILRLQSGDWGDIMMIPAVDKVDLSTYFIPYGTLDEMSKQIRFANTWDYDGLVYGVPSTGNAQGVVYNKRVFEEAGVTEIPKTPDEFIDALKAIKAYDSSIIPLYTNYADGWPMEQWDGQIAGTTTGDATYMNQKLLHTKDPFKDYGDGTHPYALYKVLYDAVADGLTEDDYSTTAWEDSKGMINRGEIATMVLGSWAYSQMVAADEHGEDVGYMPFPITIGGQQYASSGADYSYGINVNSSEENQAAAMVFVKWLTEESGFAYNEGGIPIELADNDYPDAYEAFGDVIFVSDESAAAGEEDLLNTLNADSDLMINAGGKDKVQKIIEHAANGDETFDDIMAEWNAAWTQAQEDNGVEITEE